MTAATVDVASLIGSVRGMVIRRLVNAGLVQDIDDVLGIVACRTMDRLVVRAKGGDNPAAYVWPLALGVVKDHIQAASARLGRECLYDEATVPGLDSGPDSEDRYRARKAFRAVQLIEEAVGAERWEKATSALLGEVRRASVDRSTRMWVRNVAGVIVAAMDLADEMTGATDIDLAMRCLPARDAEIILGDLAGVSGWANGFTASTAAAYRARAEKLLFHAHVAYAVWAGDHQH